MVKREDEKLYNEQGLDIVDLYADQLDCYTDEGPDGPYEPQRLTSSGSNK